MSGILISVTTRLKSSRGRKRSASKSLSASTICVGCSSSSRLEAKRDLIVAESSTIRMHCKVVSRTRAYARTKSDSYIGKECALLRSATRGREGESCGVWVFSTPAVDVLPETRPVARRTAQGRLAADCVDFPKRSFKRGPVKGEARVAKHHFEAVGVRDRGTCQGLISIEQRNH